MFDSDKKYLLRAPAALKKVHFTLGGNEHLPSSRPDKKRKTFSKVFGVHLKKTQTDCRAVVLHAFRNQERAIIIRLTVSLLGPVFFAFQTQLKL